MIKLYLSYRSMSELHPEIFSSLAHGDAGVRDVSAAADTDEPLANSILEVHSKSIRELRPPMSTSSTSLG